MKRRSLLKGMGAIALYSSFPGVLAQFASSCKSKSIPAGAEFFSVDEFQLLQQVTDILLPKTATPGALETGVPHFVDLVVKNCMTPDDQKLIQNGLQQLNGRQGAEFSSLSDKEKKSIVSQLDAAAYKNEADKAWFMIVKKLSLIGYFTSEQGMTKALNYVKVPGNYEACIPYKQGSKAMAKTFLMYW